MNPRQRLFCEEFIADRNATQAYIRAGYAPSGAKSNSSRLMANDNVQAYIEELSKESVERIELSADALLRRLWEIGNTEEKDRVPALGLLSKIMGLEKSAQPIADEDVLYPVRLGKSLQVAPWAEGLFRDYPDYDYGCAVGGRGRGASQMFARLVMRAMLEFGHNVLIGREHQKSIEQSNIRLVKQIIDESDYAQYFDTGLQQTIRCVNGATCSFKGIRYSLNSWRSLADFQLVWLEEPDQCTDEQMDIILPSIRDEGVTLVASWNPYLPKSPVEQLRDMPNARVEFATYKDNPFFPPHLEELRQTQKRTRPEEIYRWIWDGKFRPQDESAYFHYQIVEAAFEGAVGKPNDDRVAGIDIAGSTDGDYTAIIIIDNEGREVVVDRIREPDLHKRTLWLYAILSKHRTYSALVDITGGRGEAELDRLQELGIDAEGFTFSLPKKGKLMNDLRMALSDRELKLCDPLLESELLDLGETMKALTEHDDLVMALGMAWMRLQTRTEWQDGF